MTIICKSTIKVPDFINYYEQNRRITNSIFGGGREGGDICGFGRYPSHPSILVCMNS